MGDLATEVVHIGLVAMMCNASANLFDDACLNLPTLGVLYKTATLNALRNFTLSQSLPGPAKTGENAHFGPPQLPRRPGSLRRELG